jgi:NAD-dependent dihydropyrimidine dehydrogenase PreA subunit
MINGDWRTPTIDDGLCTGCGDCVQVCPVEALALQDQRVVVSHPEDCRYCGDCEELCPVGAISRGFEIILLDGA